jgi:lipoate-protein ligase B
MLILELGLTEYLAAFDLQKKMVEQKIIQRGPDILLLLEHPDTVTIGTRGKESDLLIPYSEIIRRGIAVHPVDRGGAATYHGPGQLVGYPIVDLRRMGFSVKRYVNALEETIIRALGSFGIAGTRQLGKTGVWIDGESKIASIGIRIRRRVAYHGFSLNVALKTDPSQFMVSCGIPEARMISLGEIVQSPVSMTEVRNSVIESFSDVFEVSFHACTLEQIICET